MKYKTRILNIYNGVYIELYQPLSVINGQQSYIKRKAFIILWHIHINSVVLSHRHSRLSTGYSLNMTAKRKVYILINLIYNIIEKYKEV
jgi:hypothetical protein